MAIKARRKQGVATGSRALPDDPARGSETTASEAEWNQQLDEFYCYWYLQEAAASPKKVAALHERLLDACRQFSKALAACAFAMEVDWWRSKRPARFSRSAEGAAERGKAAVKALFHATYTLGQILDDENSLHPIFAMGAWDDGASLLAFSAFLRLRPELPQRVDMALANVPLLGDAARVREAAALFAVVADSIEVAAGFFKEIFCAGRRGPRERQAYTRILNWAAARGITPYAVAQRIAKHRLASPSGFVVYPFSTDPSVPGDSDQWFDWLRRAHNDRADDTAASSTGSSTTTAVT